MNKILRKAKIVATIGPASEDRQIFTNLVKSGLNVARLNFSHGSHETHTKNITMIRSVSKELGIPITILQDLQGPKIRIGEIANGPRHFATGQQLRIEFTEGTPSSLFDLTIPFPGLQKQLIPGGRVLLDDGNVEFEIVSIEADHIVVRVVLGGYLSSHKGFNLPGVSLDIPSFTEKDKEDLAFGLQEGVDVIAISFVRTAQDLKNVRDEIQRLSPEQAALPLIAKLERPEALDNLKSILEIADGVMVARGDLGVELSPAAVPVAQKRIIQEANFLSKYVITATQMLDSMIHNPRPTRAEAADVANAVFDGTDAVMLSGETASGKYPLESIQMMDAIVCEAERNYQDWSKCDSKPEMDSSDDAVAMARAARELAHDRNVSSIVVFTHSGRTALLMSKARPTVPILAFTPKQSSYQKLSMYWGVVPFLVPFADSVESMISMVDESLLSYNPELIGQQAVLVSGFPVAHMGKPNLALLHTIGEPD